MPNLRRAFERAAPRFVAAAWDFADRAPAVDHLWVYVTHERDINVIIAYYRVGGAVHSAADLAEALPGIDWSDEAQHRLLDRLYAILDDVLAAAGDGRFPTRMVLSMDTATQQVNAEFSYSPLQPGVPYDQNVADVTLADQWLQRLRTTGNDSATL
ncbi:hypothetical protein GCM10025789_10090 [Tessaracoccus lubricantis]|uniref:Uncharacterized protein n=1 Tax=Tessaracoccus lubricantis TaxID=545543 RepID=A0ABP9FCJ7_9ACTN